MASNDPVIKSVLYNGTQVSVTWKPSDDTGVTGYIIQLSYVGQASGAIAYASGLIPGQQTAFGKLTLTAPLNTETVYLVTVQAMWGTTPGEASAPVVMPTALPVLKSAWYDGSEVSFSWVPSPQSAQGYQLIVYSLDSGLQYLATIADPAAGSGVIPASIITQPLDPNQQWAAAVAAIGENNAHARSPSAEFPKPLPTVAPTIALYQNKSRIYTRWTPLPASNVTGFRLALTSTQDDTDFWIDLPTASAASGTLPLPAPLPASQNFQFRLVALTAAGTGVSSPAGAVVNAAPALTSVAYNGNDSVVINWEPTTNGNITGYTLQVLSLASGMSYTTDIQGYFATSGSVALTAPLDATQQWVARLIANGDVGAQSGDTPIPAAIPALNTVQCDGSNVTVEWGPLNPDPGLVAVTLLSAGTVVTSALASGNTATLAIPSGAQTLTVQVTPRIGIATGGPSPAGAVVAQAPQIGALTTDPVNGNTTLNWAVVTGATAYLLHFSNGATATATTNQYLCNPALPVNASLSFTVAAQLTASGVTSIGPSSTPAELPTRQPVLLDAGFDGINAAAAWSPVKHACGYRVSVQQSGSPNVEVAFKDLPASADSASFAFTPPNTGATYVLGVQARFGNTSASGSGPLSTLLPLFKAGFFTSTAASTTSYPYVYPATSLASVSAATPGEAIALYLPEIGGATPLQGLPCEDGPFKLEQNTNPDSKAAYPYVLKFASDSAVWTFTTEPVRGTLRDHYVAFLKKAEQPTGVVPWGIVLLQQVISRYMPQTFQETLFYGYGLNFPSDGNGSAYADLRPGMVLRVAADPYQTLTESSTLKWSSGYVAGPVVDYDVGSFIDTSGNWTVGYDSFIGQLVAGNALTVPPPPFHAQTNQEGGVADAADLYFAGFRTPFYRLFVPTALATASAPCPTDTPKSFVLAAAPSFSALTTTVNTPGGTYPVAYFRGRAVVRPCIRVSLDGNEIVVPVGTTVGNLLERAGRSIAPAPAQLKGLKVRRALGPVVLDPARPVSADAHYAICFDWKTQPQYLNQGSWTALSLPLLPGDRVCSSAG